MKKVPVERFLVEQWLHENGFSGKDIRISKLSGTPVPIRKDYRLISRIMRKADATILTLFGFGLYDEELGLFLLPGDWHNILPAGCPLVNIFGEPVTWTNECDRTANKHGLLNYGVIRENV